MLAIIKFLLLIIGIANAGYISSTIHDCRIQNESNIYKPGPVLGFALEYGVFNEDSNIIDFRTATELRRFGYSHESNGNSISTSLWSIGFKPLIFRISYTNILFETYGSIGYVFNAYNINDYFEKKLFRPDNASSYSYGYGYKIGYVYNKNWEFSLIADYRYIEWRKPSYSSELDRMDFIMGGIGASVAYNFR